MFYAIVGHDVEDSRQRRQEARPAHVMRLRELQKLGRLLLAGPFPCVDAENPGDAGFSGSLIVAEFDSLESAREWANADPYIAAGVYSNVDVRPFRRTFPE